MKKKPLRSLRPVQAVTVPSPGSAQPPTFSAFEISQIAIQLCQLSRGEDPEAFFTPAYQLLSQASEFLHHPHRESLKKMLTDSPSRQQQMVRLDCDSLERLKIEHVDLPTLLLPLGQAHGGNKPLVRLGSITSMQGLELAIKKAFSTDQASRILRERRVSIAELRHLEEDIKSRTLERGRSATLQRKARAAK
jgi:hypothetical protein